MIEVKLADPKKKVENLETGRDFTTNYQSVKKTSYIERRLKDGSLIAKPQAKKKDGKK